MAHSAGTEWWRPAAARGPSPPADSAVPFGALMIFTGIILLAPQVFVPELGRIRFALITGVCGVVAHCWTRFAAGRPLLRLTRETWLAGALLVWAVATLPLSESPGGSLRILLDLYLKSLIIFGLLSNTVNTLGRLRTVAWGLSLMALPLAGLVVWNFMRGDAYTIEFMKTSGQTVVTSTGRFAAYDAPLTGNPNGLALMLNLILPLTAALFLASRRLIVRGLLAGMMVLSVGAIVLTFSRGGFLTLATTLFLYMGTLLKRGERKWVVLVLVLAVGTIPFLPSGYLDRLGTITDHSADPTGSAQARLRDTRAALILALHHPFVGTGLGMNVLALNELRGPTWQPVHNVYLEYAVDLGWLGLGLFLLLLIHCIRGAARVRDRCIGTPALGELSVLADAIRITLLAFSVAAFFHPIAYHVYFYYFAALAVAVGAVYEAESRSLDRIPPGGGAT